MLGGCDNHYTTETVEGRTDVIDVDKGGAMSTFNAPETFTLLSYAVCSMKTQTIGNVLAKVQ